MRIAIAEDHHMFREVIRKVCVDEFGYEVVAEAVDGPEAIRVALTTQPDLLLLDLNLPGLDGFAVLEAIRKARCPAKVIAFTSARGDYTVFRIEKAGFDGFVDKGTDSLVQLRLAIESVAKGKRFYSDTFHQAREARLKNPLSFDKVLSDRERECLGLIGGSFSDDEIAVRMGIARRTVSTFRQKIMDKLDVHNAPKLIRFATEHGFTQVPVQDQGGVAFP
jgi:DNA-binding NarL/FixJ family response regulator